MLFGSLIYHIMCINVHIRQQQFKCCLYIFMQRWHPIYSLIISKSFLYICFLKLCLNLLFLVQSWKKRIFLNYHHVKLMMNYKCLITGVLVREIQHFSQINLINYFHSPQKLTYFFQDNIIHLSTIYWTNIES